MRNAALFRERPLVLRIITGGVVPTAFGAVTGSFEHRDGWEGADRGLIGGALFGTGLLVAHALAGTHAQVSLPKFAPILVVFTAIVGMFAGALGGRLRRTAMEQPSGSASAGS